MLLEQSALNFDEAQAKTETLEAYEWKTSGLLAEARRIAHAFARDDGTVTIDEVRSCLGATGWLVPGYPLDFLGSVFLERDETGRRVWTKAGYRTSTTKGRKCGHIWVWRLA
jgi:hypothetical protein